MARPETSAPSATNVRLNKFSVKLIEKKYSIK
jgi:hypothetical protein